MLLLLHATHATRALLQGVCGAGFALAHSLCVCELDLKPVFGTAPLPVVAAAVSRVTFRERCPHAHSSGRVARTFAALSAPF